MNEVRINLNEVIKVKLTDLGKDIYYHQFDELNRRRGKIVIQPFFPKEDAEGYTEFQLWDFMEIYGKHIGMAQPNVIKPLEIVYELSKEGNMGLTERSFLERMEEMGLTNPPYTPKKGKWRFHKDGSGTCSECGFTQKNVWDMDSWQNFCGHCGADMREG